MDVKLVFVMEGEPPHLKADVISKRNQVRYGPSGKTWSQKTGRSHFKSVLNWCWAMWVDLHELTRLSKCLLNFTFSVLAETWHSFLSENKCNGSMKELIGSLQKLIRWLHLKIIRVIFSSRKLILRYNLRT